MRRLVGSTSLALGLAVLAACGSFTDTRAPWEHKHDHDVGLPVLGYRWKKTLIDNTTATRPQELARVGVFHGGERASAVFAGSHAGMLHAYDPDNGRELWQRRIGAMSSDPLLAGDTLFVGTDDGTLFAIDPTTGSVRWKHQASGPIVRAPAISGDTIVFTTELDKVIALDRTSGKFRWHYERQTPEEFTIRGNAGAAIAENRVFCGFADGHVVALSLGAGEVVWVRSLAGDASQFIDVDTTPIVADGAVYAASAAGGLYALSTADGTERWHVAMNGVGQLLLDENRLFAVAAEEGVYAVDLGGHVLWRQGFPKAGDPGPPIVDGSYLMLSYSDDGLFILDKRDGSLIQSFNPGSGFSTAAAVSHGMLFIVSNAGILYALNVSRFT